MPRLPLPTIQGLIDRRMLVNFRVDPAVASKLIPAPFRPKLIAGHAMAGICLIRLKHIRPAFIPFPLGISSENAAHRFAVEWDDAGGTHQGVYIPRRDTSSRLSTLAGGRLFPGEHHLADFDVTETPSRFHIRFASHDHETAANVDASLASGLPPTSLFKSLADASSFFQAGSLGYSATRHPHHFDGLELQCRRWDVQPLAMDHIASTYFDNPALFPKGSATFDCALLMRNILHQWHPRGALCCN